MPAADVVDLLVRGAVDSLLRAQGTLLAVTPA
jgi:hypothetical protein